MIDFLTPDNFKFVFKGRLGQRRCVRVYHPELKVSLSKGEEYPIKDLNTYGVAFKCKTCNYLPGDTITLSIIFKGEKVIKEIQARIKRIEHQTVCCEFLDLDRRKEFILDRLVLSIQKEQIGNKKDEKV